MAAGRQEYKMTLMKALRAWARTLKRDVLALWLAARDPRTPWWIKGLALAVAAYAFSPVDLIPDFIPVLGYVDDLLLVPLGIWLVVRLMPADLMAELRLAAAGYQRRPVSCIAGLVIILIWIAAAALFAGMAVKLLNR